MKLLFVVHQFFPDCHSGTEQYTLAVAREARRRGDDVVILSLEPNFGWSHPELVIFDKPYDDFRVPRLRYYEKLAPNLVLRDYENPRVSALFGEFLDEEQPDAIHFFHLRHLGSDFLEVARARGIRMVVNLMDFWYLCPRFTLLRSDGSLCEGPPDEGRGCVECAYPELVGVDPNADTLEGESLAALLRRPKIQFERLALADEIVAPSRFLAGMFARNGFPLERLTVVPYGLEPGRVRALEVARPRSPLRVGFAGVLSPWKAPHLCVEALQQIEGDGIELTIHGRTDEGMFQEYIDRMLESARGDTRIRFPGPFDHGQLDQVMADMDVLVVPSLWYENTPFVVLEALEAGVPVIVSNLGGLSEVVETGRNGYLFEAGSADALAQVLRDCLAEPSRLRDLELRPPGSIASNYEVFRPMYEG